MLYCNLQMLNCDWSVMVDCILLFVLASGPSVASLAWLLSSVTVISISGLMFVTFLGIWITIAIDRHLIVLRKSSVFCSSF